MSCANSWEVIKLYDLSIKWRNGKWLWQYDLEDIWRDVKIIWASLKLKNWDITASCLYFGGMERLYELYIKLGNKSKMWAYNLWRTRCSMRMILETGKFLKIMSLKNFGEQYDTLWVTWKVKKFLKITSLLKVWGMLALCEL